MISKFRNRISAWLLQPPYNGVIWCAWLYVVFACFYAGGGPFAGDLVWFDDRVRLVQIFDWLNGQNWHDRTIMRVDPPEGFHTIWSRVVDLPAAAIIAALQNFVGQMQAGMIAAIIVPLAETLLLFFAVGYFARPLVGHRHAKLVTLFVLFGSCINPESFTLAGFHVGMVGHHAAYVLLTLLLFGSVARLILTSDRRHVMTAGLAIGGLLTIGIEALPLIAGACFFTGLAGWFQNRLRLIRDAARFTLLGMFFGLLLLPANQPPEKILEVSFAEPSILGPIFLLAAAAFFAGQYLLQKNFGEKPGLSLGLAALWAVTLACLLILGFPQLLEGGAVALTPEERQLAAAEHPEAESLFRVAWNTADYLRMALPPIIAALFAAFEIRRTPSRRRRAIDLFYLGLVGTTFAMASVYSRYFHYLGLALSPWLLLIWQRAARRLTAEKEHTVKNFALYVLVGPFWLWLIPAFLHHLPMESVLLFPARLQTEPQRCDTKDIAEFLNRHYGPDATIIVPMYRSDRFLLHTHLKIFFLANFPSHNKFIEARSFYETTSTEEARFIAVKRGIDLVAFCPGSDLIAHPSPFMEMLMRGRRRFGQLLAMGQAPDWLKPVAMPAPWLLFEVDKKKAAVP